MLESILTAVMLYTASHSRPVCNNDVVIMLQDAGFKGNDLRAAWAITWRESNHRNLDESSPYYSGALGFWQIQTSAHSDKSWWSRDAMLDPARQSRIAYKYLTAKGTNWIHWGLGETKSGKFYMDTTLYGGWSSDQQYSWIWSPFQTGWDMFPNKCKSLL